MLLISSLLILVLLHYFFQTGLAFCPNDCAPSACGNFHNISYPFRLKDDPKNCGDHRFELACENNVTSIYLNSHKYYVKAINYRNDDGDSTIRLVDASINNHTCSFPLYSSYAYNFSVQYPYSISSYSNYPFVDVAWPINFMSCTTATPLKNSSLFTDITHHCASNSSSHARYIKAGHMYASEVLETCGVDLIVMTSWKFKDSNNVSLSEINHALLYGFELIFDRICVISSETNLDRFKNFFEAKLLSPLLILVVILVLSGVNPVMAIVGFTVGLGLLLAIAIHVYYVKRDFSGFSQLYSYNGTVSSSIKFIM
ncbi:hypothetical protein C2S51_015646 [Perilla frutescens var. frutescens]|nr:hypothetical protein C2S51_015646 [Perilla frutescens var. frutescens]